MLLRFVNYVILALIVAVVIVRLNSDRFNVSFATETALESSNETWQVRSIADGDTISVYKDGETRRVRFCGIDTPEVAHNASEINQPLGVEAMEFVKSRIDANGDRISVNFIERDRYGRWIGELHDDSFLNADLVEAGLAWPYKQYWGNCPNKKAIEKAEKDAIASGKFIGNNPENIPPWEWRKNH